jgi:hypothetical protein
MTTLADLRDRLRIELHDPDEERWDDDALDRHIARAVQELSLKAPWERRTTLETSAGSRELDLAALTGRIDIYAVEYPAGLYPAVFVRHSVFAETLTLLIDEAPDAGEDVIVYWGALHEVNDEGSTLPAPHEDIVLTGAAGYAAIELASFATNRANLAGPSVVGDYAEWGRERLDLFRRQVRELPQAERLRSSRLYTPAEPANSQDVVQWQP